MPATLNIRPTDFNDADLTQILPFEQKSFFFDAFTAEQFRLSASTCEFNFVAEINGKIVGYSMARITNNQGDFVSLAVDPSYTHQGIGRKLFEFLLNKMREAHLPSALLEVRKDNAGAIRLYKKVGFAITGEKLNFYEDGAPAYVMEKLL